MSAPVFIGDEVTASAYRLAGMVTRVPKKGDVANVFDAATGAATLVVISAEYAALLPGETLREAVRRADPLILVVPDGGNRRLPEDLDSRVDRVLGIER
jgi:vacuolar-type H+-ATPase subunit F/Vma7